MSADDNGNAADDDEAEEAARHGHVWDWRSKSAVLILIHPTTPRIMTTKGCED